MRVGLVLEEFDPSHGGLEQWTSQFASCLAQKGHEVHVVARRFAKSAATLPIIAHAIGDVGPRLGFAKFAEVKLRSLKLDVIHDMGSGWYSDVFQPHGSLWTVVMKRKLLRWPRYLRPAKHLVDQLLPRVREFKVLAQQQYANKGQVIVALSQSVADDFQRFQHVRPEQIRVIYNGVDTYRFSPEHRTIYRELMRQHLGVGDQTVLALIVAHNFWLKGVLTLLHAMGRLAAEQRPVHLVVVGGKRLKPWQRIARQLGVEETVTFVGPTENTVPYYAAADMYVHPTFYDACSLVLLEAAASGLPVITTRHHNGVSELFTEDKEVFLLAAPDDADEVAGRMRALLDDLVRRRMGNAAREMALMHTFDRNVDEILAVYHEVVVRARARAA